MITDIQKKINALRAQTAALEAKLAEERAKDLLALPAKHGFGSVGELIAALTKAAKARRAPAAAKTPPASGKTAKKKRRKRAVITEATRAEVKKLVAAGKSGREIAKAVRISLPSVQNIKKALGLVKKK